MRHSFLHSWLLHTPPSSTSFSSTSSSCAWPELEQKASPSSTTRSHELHVGIVLPPHGGRRRTRGHHRLLPPSSSSSSSSAPRLPSTESPPSRSASSSSAISRSFGSCSGGLKSASSSCSRFRAHGLGRRVTRFKILGLVRHSLRLLARLLVTAQDNTRTAALAPPLPATHARARTHTHARTHTYTHTHTHRYKHAHTHTCMKYFKIYIRTHT